MIFKRLVRCLIGKGGGQMWEPNNMKSTWPEVYEVPAELTEKQLDCALGQWGTEVLFHRYFQSSTCRTLDAEEADFFLVPVYSTCLFTKERF